jgi:hypothetical protein
MPLPYEWRLQCALRDLRSGKFKVTAAAARKHQVAASTLGKRRRKIHGPRRRRGNHPSSKLSNYAERVLYQWITRLSTEGLAPEPRLVKLKAESLAKVTVSRSWVSRFTKRYPELRSRISKRMDRERLRAEDKEVYGGHFAKVSRLNWLILLTSI